MNNITQLLQQAQKLQGRFKQMQTQMENQKIEGAAGGGMVRAVVNGKQELLEIRIDPDILDPKDPEMLEELVTAAVNNALEKSRAILGEEMNRLAGGMSLPGFLTTMFGG
ncbi:YbaB/EbfC family nucleoid-associated protein [bacterium]|nr:YbaB/EbfC family nucleoid-associated protein [bacterium]